MVSKERIQSILLSKGLTLEKISKDPRVFESACHIAYRAIPVPVRWFVGKSRVRKMVNMIKEQVSQSKIGSVPLRKKKVR